MVSFLLASEEKGDRQGGRDGINRKGGKDLTN